jgi:GT2 family glycosyltransferase
MNIHVILVVYALDVRSLVAELEAPDVFFHLYTHSRRVEATEICYWAQALHPNINLHDYGVNRGLARSWSDGIVEATEMGADAIIVVNDDIRMSRHDLKFLASSAIAHREAGVIVVTGENIRMQGHLDLGYSVFAINPIAIEKVGVFDVNYWPIYGEDVDYSYRLTLAGVPILNAGDTDVVHQGSMSVAVAPELKEFSPPNIFGQ